MSDSEGKVLWQEIEPLPPWEVRHLFPLSRSIRSCCRLLVCLMLFSKARSSYVSGPGNTLVTVKNKTWLLPWTCPFIRLPKVFSPLVPPFTAGSSRPLQWSFFPLLLKKHMASFCLWSWSLAPYFSQLEVHRLSPGPFWRSVHTSHPSCKRQFTH